MAASESFVEVRKYRWSDGSETTERSDGCANLVCLISFASFLAGVGCIAGSGVCYVLAILFWFLSFVWLFKTDLEFEGHYAAKIGELNIQLNNLKSQQPKFPNDEGYMAKFRADQSKKESEIREKIAKLEQQRETERVKRGGTRIVPVGKELGDEEAPPPEEDPLYQKVIATEQMLRVGTERYINEEEEVAMNKQLEKYVEEDLLKNPDRLSHLMKQRSVSQDEAKAEIRSTMFEEFCNELIELRSTSREEARLKVRMAIMSSINGTPSEEEEALLARVRSLNI